MLHFYDIIFHLFTNHFFFEIENIILLGNVKNKKLDCISLHFELGLEIQHKKYIFLNKSKITKPNGIVKNVTEKKRTEIKY